MRGPRVRDDRRAHQAAQDQPRTPAHHPWPLPEEARRVLPREAHRHVSSTLPGSGRFRRQEIHAPPPGTDDSHPPNLIFKIFISSSLVSSSLISSTLISSSLLSSNPCVSISLPCFDYWEYAGERRHARAVRGVLWREILLVQMGHHPCRGNDEHFCQVQDL